MKGEGEREEQKYDFLAGSCKVMRLEIHTIVCTKSSRKAEPRIIWCHIIFGQNMTIIYQKEEKKERWKRKRKWYFRKLEHSLVSVAMINRSATFNISHAFSVVNSMLPKNICQIKMKDRTN
jgi:hypothetical protein